MGGGDYVCHDCRRRGDEERRRRRIAGPKRQKRGVHTTRSREGQQDGVVKIEEVPVTERPRRESMKNAIQHWTELTATEVPALLRLQQEALSGTEGGVLDEDRKSVVRERV